MRHKNHVSLIGTVGKDAEVRNTQSGVPYARFSLATSEGGFTRQYGQQVPEVTQWHNITAWRELSQFCGKFIKKGMKVDVEGKIVYSEYTDQQGQKRMGVEIMASDIVLMSMSQNQQQGQAQNVQGGGYQQRPVQNQGGGYQQQQPRAPQNQYQGQYQGQQQQPQYGGGAPFPPPQSGGTPGADDLPF